ncbi:MAG: response regulator [Deltaproteobacteria bacterium]|nr:response regulator [Deltaproteobacteria bacterium]
MVKTILVADDSKTIQQAVNLTFRATEFEVVGAADGEEALRRLSEAKPAVILADITMPKKNGYELCGAVKNDASTAEIPVLLLAGPFDPLDEGQARQAKADGHLAKPFETQALIDRIKQVTSPEALAALASQRAAAAAPPAPAPVKAPEAPAHRPAAPAKAPAPAVAAAAATATATATATAVAAKSAPSLEPPPAPSEWAGGKTEVAPVDVWALADGAPAPQSEAPAMAVAAKSAAAGKAAAAIADAAAEPIAELAATQVPGLSKAELTRVARDVIEHIAWDVVPDLAETIIRAELKRLLAETHV